MPITSVSCRRHQSIKERREEKNSDMQVQDSLRGGVCQGRGGEGGVVPCGGWDAWGGVGKGNTAPG